MLFKTLICWLCVALLLVSNRIASAEPITYLKAGYFYCPEPLQAVFFRILDADSDDQLQVALNDAVLSGACTGRISGPMVVSDVVEKRSQSGIGYYCFTFRYPDGELGIESECSVLGSLTTVAEQKIARTGDYEIVGEGEGGLKAMCKEGGYVVIYKDQKWIRWSSVLPTRGSREGVAISNNKEYEIRQGCRGVDAVE